jgi:hypothetical protein
VWIGEIFLLTRNLKYDRFGSLILISVLRRGAELSSKLDKRRREQMVKRVVITTILGLIFGCVSWIVCNYAMGHTQPLSVNLVMILFNGLLGFCIGISSLRWPWVIHGLVLGALFGAILGLVAVAQGSQFIWPLVFGVVYGILIELIATAAFKAGVASSRTTQ